MRRKYEKLFWIVLIILVLASISTSVLAKDEPSENNVALVNGSVLTQEDLRQEIENIRQQFIRMGKPITDSQLPRLRREALENLINLELLYQESQKQAIEVKKKEVDTQLSKIKSQFPSEAKFKEELEKLNLSEATLKSQIKRGMTVQKFVDEQFAQKITVSQKDMQEYYTKHPDFFKQQEQVRAQHILIKVDPGADESKKADAYKQIEQINKKIQNGQDFATLAKEFSQCPSSTKGGDLNYFGRGQMVKPFEEAAFALKPNEVSNIVETRFGYHLIKVIDKKPEMTLHYDDVKGKIEQYLKKEKVYEKIDTYVSTLKEKAHIERFLTINP
ncbi:MAG: peptidylprolyl isomerase [Thermodesulfobacteriota bacterium]|nr:peptidylprolyl isomerase [Thermodesulfobacteriota bacterium]